MDLKKILTENKTIAVVGLSPKESRPSYGVSLYMQNAGYKIVPVRPGVDNILGEKAYPSLSDIPFPVDIVDVFRKSEAVPPIAREAVNIGAKVLWLQEGVSNEEAEKDAADAGLAVVSNRCILKVHRELLG
jgi:predicted CoA-binding protein